jgi:beta-N-acetylhexosaminidase
MRQMQAAASGAAPLQGRALERFEAALHLLKARKPFDKAAAEAQLARVLALAAGSAESV